MKIQSALYISTSFRRVNWHENGTGIRLCGAREEKEGSPYLAPIICTRLSSPRGFIWMFRTGSFVTPLQRFFVDLPNGGDVYPWLALAGRFERGEKYSYFCKHRGWGPRCKVGLYFNGSSSSIYIFDILIQKIKNKNKYLYCMWKIKFKKYIRKT